ncbi:MAG: glucan biosynthesis protein [Thiothrix sp.]
MKPNLPLWLFSTLILIMASASVQAADGCFGHVQQLAEQLSAQPFSKTPMMQVDTGRITYDHYQHIKFKGNQTYWRDEMLPFQLEFMHPGMHFIRPIELFEWKDGQATPIKFSSKYYDYSEVKDLHLERDEDKMAFTGLRILSKLGGKHSSYTETLVFQGASYFRALGLDSRYGLSARGLGINTSLEGQEEFPDYTKFWLEKPARDAEQLVLCALLDSPSTTGATRFVLTPGKTTGIEVETQLYPRQGMAEIGVAPLTSMFFHGENSQERYGDYRPEVHDSDGLLIQQGKDWRWQPLVEVPYFNFQSLPLDGISGFGLMQRDRNFDHYQDLEAWYHARPSVWVEPMEDWGKGSIQLLRLHTESDTVDNVVAYWKSDAGQDFRHLHYRLSWGMDEPPAHTLGKAVSTLVTNRAVDSMPGHKGRMRFIVDFAGMPSGKEAPEAEVTFDGKGHYNPPVVVENPYTKGWRVITAVFPEICEKDATLTIQLTNGGNPASEIWSYPIPETLCNAP